MNICFSITDINWQLTKDVFEVVASLATVLGVAAAGYFGFQGLKTWRWQLRGTEDHKLALRVLNKLLAYREAMVQLRSPTIWGYEYEALADGGKDWDARRFEAFVGEYTRRQTEVTKFRIELGALFLECEALWDNTLDELFKSVFGLEHEFTMYLYLHLRIINPAFDEFSKQKYQSMIGTRRNVLYNTTGNDDEFQAELNGYLEKMQTYLKEKLVT